MPLVARSFDDKFLSKNLIKHVEEFAFIYQPELKLTVLENAVALQGVLSVSGPKGVFDAYQVCIGVPFSFPLDEPVVYEVGERIPKTPDRHINPGSNSCCLGVWEEWLLTTSSPSFTGFMNELVNDYFTSQSWFELYGEWPYGQRSHGQQGVAEAYCRLLDIDLDANAAESYLRLLGYNNIKGHHWCSCGSGLRLRKCHISKVRKLQMIIAPSMANRMLQRLTANG